MSKSRKRDRRAEPTSSEESRSALSRRSFLRAGTAGALGAGLADGAVALESEPASADSAPAVHGPTAVDVRLRVNGRERTVRVEPRVTLLDALRDELRVTGPKRVCDRATCGACTVLQDGRPVYACSRLAVECEGAELVTVEGLGDPEQMHEVQRAFVENDAQQCGFCTPGFVVAMAALLERHPQPSERQIEDALGGNLCRCGTYGGLRNVLSQLGEVG